jgi:hypothetical protein
MSNEKQEVRAALKQRLGSNEKEIAQDVREQLDVAGLQQRRQGRLSISSATAKSIE